MLILFIFLLIFDAFQLFSFTPWTSWNLSFPLSFASSLLSLPYSFMLCCVSLTFFLISISHAYLFFNLFAFLMSISPFPSLLCSRLAFLCPLSTLHPPSLPCPTAKGGVIKSLEDMGAVVTNLALGTTRCLVPLGPRASPKKKASTTEKEDTLVMDTKLKIIEILEVREP